MTDLSQLSAAEIDALPFGYIGLSPEGTLLYQQVSAQARFKLAWHRGPRPGPGASATPCYEGRPWRPHRPRVKSPPRRRCGPLPAPILRRPGRSRRPPRDSGFDDPNEPTGEI